MGNSGGGGGGRRRRFDIKTFAVCFATSVAAAASAATLPMYGAKVRNGVEVKELNSKEKKKREKRNNKYENLEMSEFVVTSTHWLVMTSGFVLDRANNK